MTTRQNEDRRWCKSPHILVRSSPSFPLPRTDKTVAVNPDNNHPRPAENERHMSSGSVAAQVVVEADLEAIEEVLLEADGDARTSSGGDGCGLC